MITKPQFSLYGFDESTASEGAAIPSIGVTDGWKFAGVDYVPADNGKSAYMDINFVNTSGAKTNLREYEIDESREGAEKKAVAQQKRTKHVMTKFMDEAQARITNVATFEQFAKQFKHKLETEGDTSKEFRLLLQYNNKGYASLPPFVPFIEVVEDGVPSKLESTWENSTIYQKEKPTPDDEQTSGFGSDSGDVADF